MLNKYALLLAASFTLGCSQIKSMNKPLGQSQQNALVNQASKGAINQDELLDKLNGTTSFSPTMKKYLISEGLLKGNKLVSSGSSSQSEQRQQRGPNRNQQQQKMHEEQLRENDVEHEQEEDDTTNLNEAMNRCIEAAKQVRKAALDERKTTELTDFARKIQNALTK